MYIKILDLALCGVYGNNFRLIHYTWRCAFELNLFFLMMYWQGIPKVEPSSDLQNIVEVVMLWNSIYLTFSAIHSWVMMHCGPYLKIKTPEQIERMRETCRVSNEGASCDLWCKYSINCYIVQTILIEKFMMLSRRWLLQKK